MYLGAITEKRFEYKGFPCVVIMQAMCFRTGYIGVPVGHRLYGNTEDSEKIDCHGGVTYCNHFLIGQDDKDTWWIGFDTGHFCDGYDEETARELFKDYPESLRTIDQLANMRFIDIENPAATLEYCEQQCRNMVDQIIEEEKCH